MPSWCFQSPASAGSRRHGSCARAGPIRKADSRFVACRPAGILPSRSSIWNRAPNRPETARTAQTAATPVLDEGETRHARSEALALTSGPLPRSITQVVTQGHLRSLWKGALCCPGGEHMMRPSHTRLWTSTVLTAVIVTAFAVIPEGAPVARATIAEPPTDKVLALWLDRVTFRRALRQDLAHVARIGIPDQYRAATQSSAHKRHTSRGQARSVRDTGISAHEKIAEALRHPGAASEKRRERARRLQVLNNLISRRCQQARIGWNSEVAKRSKGSVSCCLS